MRVAMMTTMIAAVLVMLFPPVQAAELESGFMGTKWATPAMDLKGFTKVGGSDKTAYYLPLAKQVNAEMKKNLENEPPAPIFPANPFRLPEALGPEVEFMRF